MMCFVFKLMNSRSMAAPAELGEDTLMKLKEKLIENWPTSSAKL